MVVGIVRRVVGVVVLTCVIAPASARVDGGSERVSNDILVTARRMSEPEGAVPIAINVVRGDEIARHRIAELQDLQRLIPAMQVSQINRDDALIAIRGQGPGIAAFPGVLTYLNDVPFRGLGQGLYYDLASVEVLKGPQGTLFGRNSNGGAILFRSARPVDRLEGYAKASLGNYHDRSFEGAANLPLSETLAVRVAGNVAKRNGFTSVAGIDRRLDDRGFAAGRLSIRWQPDARVTSDLIADYTRVRTNGTSSILLDINPAGPLALFPPQTGIPGIASALLAQQRLLGPRTQVGFSTEPVRRSNHYGIMHRFEIDLGNEATFTNIAAYRRYRRLTRTDYDGTPLQLVDFSTTPDGWDVDDRQFTEEAQLRRTIGKVGFTIGGYHQSNSADDDQRQTGTLYYQPILLVSQAKDRSDALYGELRYDAAAWLDGLSLSASYRHTWDRRRQRAATLNLATTTCSGVGAMLPDCRLEEAARFDAGNYAFTASWTASPNLLIYATTRRGYKSGGLNLGQPLANRESYQPEYLTDVEAGVKTGFSLGQIKGRASLAAYRGRYRDVQVIGLLIDGTALYNIVENGARATLSGIEADLTASIGERLDITAGYAFTDARYDRYVSSIYGDLSSSPWPYTSRHKGNVSATYRLPSVQNTGEPSLSVLYSVQSSLNFGYEPDPATREPGYGIVNARFDLRRIGGQPIDLSVIATNLTNKTYRAGVIGIYNTAGIDSAVFCEPRMYGAQLTWRFGEVR
jgi:iron complex outermembrane receptor protein